MHIPITDAPLPFTPPSLGPDSKVVFLIRPQAQVDLDRLGYDLFRHNIVQMSSEDFRAAMIDEVFNLYPGDEGERRANLIDEHWQADDLYKNRLADWTEQENQRLFDEKKGAPRREAIDPPKHTQPLRARTEATMVIKQAREASMRLRDLTVEQMTFDAKQREGMCRLVIMGWSGLSTSHTMVNALNDEGGIIPDDVWRAMKKEIGPIAVQQLVTHIMRFGEVEDTEKGNSDSPLEKQSDLNGSEIPNGVLVTSAGSSTSGEDEALRVLATSPSTPTPDIESAPTIGSSSSSTSASTGASASIDALPMGAE